MHITDTLVQFLGIKPPFSISKVFRDETEKEAHIHLKVDPSATPEGYRIHSYYERSWEHLRLFEYRTFLHCSVPIYQHRQSKELKKAEVSFSRDYSRFTLHYEAELMRLMKIHHCFQQVADQLGIYAQRVEQIYHYYTDHLAEDVGFNVPQKVAFDETSTKKGHQYITTFYDLDLREIVGIYEGRSSDCVGDFYQDHPNPEVLRQVSMDMSPAFIKGVKTYFPQAQISFDKWHVIKLFRKHLKDLPAKKARKLKAQLRLVMESIGQFYQAGSQEEAQATLAFVGDFAQDQLGENKLTNTIQKHFEGICNYFVSKLNNGIMEGLNSKIQVIKRVARGFRYTQHFMKMIRFVFSKEPLASNFI